MESRQVHIASACFCRRFDHCVSWKICQGAVMRRSSESRYVPALGFHWLTRYYDAVVGTTARERSVKQALINQARVEPGQRVLDLARSEEHTSELQSLMRISYAVFCLKKKKIELEIK